MRATDAQKNMSRIHASVHSRVPGLRGEPPQEGATLKPAEISNPLFLFQGKKKFLPLTAAQRSDTTILIQLIRLNDLKIKQKFSKVMIQQLTHGHQLSSGERV